MNARLKHKAYHALRLADGMMVEGPVSVTFDNDDKIISWHLLTGEEPFTEWIGGLYIDGK